MIQNGYDKKGNDRDGYDRNGQDAEGYYKDGYNSEGYNKNGLDRNGEYCAIFDKVKRNKQEQLKGLIERDKELNEEIMELEGKNNREQNSI